MAGDHDSFAERLFAEAEEADRRAKTARKPRRLAAINEYVYDKAQAAYWDLVTLTLHEEKSVDASIPRGAWEVLDDGIDEAPEDEEAGPGRRRRGRPRARVRLRRPSETIRNVENDLFVEGSTWAPGRPRIIEDYFIDADGWQPIEGIRILNQYREPPPSKGKPEGAERWIAHVRKLWPDPKEHEPFFDYCAHMIQRPEEKANFAVVLSGTQGIGKDAALYPVRMAAGEWNAKNIDPDELFAPFKPWLQCLMLTIDEVRPTKDEHHASSFYNILKPITVTPPNTIAVNVKYQQMRHIVNVVRVFITTNDFLAMHIPDEDRRMHVMHSLLPARWHEAAGEPEYFGDFFHWLEKEGGLGDVAAWLAARDLSRFNPKKQIEKTEFRKVVAETWKANDDEVAIALEYLKRPEVFFGQELIDVSFDDREFFANFLRSSRKSSLRLMRDGYVRINRTGGGEWKFAHEGRVFRSRVAFVKQDLIANRDHVDQLLEDRGRMLAETEPPERELRVVHPKSNR